MHAVNHLGQILARKRREVARRKLHRALARPRADAVASVELGARAVACLRRADAAMPRVIAEIKMRSPSAGVIRERRTGSVQSIAAGYAAAGAAAVSVLCDGPGFGGSPLDVRRAASAVRMPVLFKEFVLDPVQVELARRLGASMVLLLVNALDPERLIALVDAVLEHGMAPIVEAADDDELELALSTRSVIIGVNARDLRTFQVDPARARRLIARIPSARIAIHMSGITSADEFLALGQSRADAVLIGEALMRAPEPGARLHEWIARGSAG